MRRSWAFGIDMKKTTFFNAAHGSLYAPAKAPFVELASNSKPLSQIVIPARPGRLEDFAAKELQACFLKISGARLPIRREGSVKPGEFAFFLGQTRRAASLKLPLTEKVLGRDGFVVRSIPQGMVLQGRNELGTLFAVYELLERYFDVRWFMPGAIGEHVPCCENPCIGRVELTLKPAFQFRWVGSGDWALRQRMNSDVSVKGEAVGVRWKWAYHTFRILIPPEKYFGSHPEFFALIKGYRSVSTNPTHGNQLCTSNPALIKEVAKNLSAALDAEPGVDVVSLSPNDGGGFCECETCCALDEPATDWYGRYSRRLATFANAVARLVGRKHPRVLIKIGAYTLYARVPSEPGFKLEPNIVVQLCHLWFCHKHYLGSNACRKGSTYPAGKKHFLPNQEYEKILKQWKKRARHIFVYEYCANRGLERVGLPWPLAHVLARDIPFYLKHGVEGFYTQLFESLWHRDGLLYYMAAKLCWNADLEPVAIFNDYMNKFYGPAAQAMKSYFITVEGAMEKMNLCVSYGLTEDTGLQMGGIGLKIFTPRVMAQMEKHLRKAEQLAATHPLAKARVALIRRSYQEACKGLINEARLIKKLPASLLKSLMLS